MFDTVLGSVDMEMNYNPYTPPSSNEDSPQPYLTLSSPESYLVLNATPTYMSTSDIQAHYNLDQYGTLDRRPYLQIIEQPTEKFRFRYKSEMAGTHGSLNGQCSDKTRKQTFPTVELRNFDSPAIVRCSLYQYHSSLKERQPHAHRLIKKCGNEEVDDPHPLTVGPSEGFTAVFHSMGIIHTAKKNVVEELYRKKTLLKEEEVARAEGIRKLRKDELVNVKQEAEEESKSINMNIVCLRFDAFIKQNNILIPICEPVYSHCINNLKSALTGELKIVRMDHNSSPAKGNREIFMLVEKVTKKNIKIRFFELSEDSDTEIWYDYGKFTELDVHHQYAIVFKTPPYRNLEISEQRKVYVELERITDGSKSEPREFKYYPSPNYQPGMKRSRMSSSYSYSNSGSWGSSVEKQAVLPVTLIDQPELFPIDSEEFEKMFHELKTSFMFNPQKSIHVSSEDFNVAADGPRDKYKELNRYSEPKLSQEELAIIDRVYSEFKSLLATKPTPDHVNNMLVTLFEEHITEDKQNALHILVKLGNPYKLRGWLEAIKRSNQSQIFNFPNKDGYTIGHLAVLCGNVPILRLICDYDPDFSILDNEGNTPLHLAIIKNSYLVIVDCLVRSRKSTKLPINSENNDSLTALHLAVSKRILPYVRVLCEQGADVNAIDKKSGCNVLHVAVKEQASDIVKYLVGVPNINLLHPNYQDMTPYQMAKRLVTDSKDYIAIEICNTIEMAMQQKGLHVEVFIKEEQESEEEMDCAFEECKSENYTAEELKDMYRNVKFFTNECLYQVSAMLDESGKWENLALLLDMQHIIFTDMFKKANSKSKQLLQSAEKECDLYVIRDFLENLEETDAVVAMDRMVLSLQSP